MDITPNLWSNADHSVVLFDIPRSIAHAQGFNAEYELLSVSPISSPFLSNEPKTKSAKARLEHNVVDAKLHEDYHVILTNALEEMRREKSGLWCLPRSFVAEAPRMSKKRKLEAESKDKAMKSESKSKDLASPQRSLPLDLLSCLARSRSRPDPVYGAIMSRSASLEHADDNENSHIVVRDDRFFANESDKPSKLEVRTSPNEDTYSFHVPSGSSFFIGDCADARSFRTALTNQAKKLNTRTTFDFILLDPPWPNRSVRRTHKTAGSTYAISPTLADTRTLLTNLQLETLLADNGLVGIWITNKPAIRNLVLGEGGLFALWQIDLIEEWLWLKTTIHGEPVTALDALWRKPYEVFLLGRRKSTSTERVDLRPPLSATGLSIRQKVIIGVPDLHSRKPCLKTIIEPYMRDVEGYRALEVFARNLVAGWWSWGDECVKFNWEGCWREKDTAEILDREKG